MDEITNPIMVEIQDLYHEYEHLRKIGQGANDGRQTALLDEAGKLFDSNLSDFTPEEMINGFKNGTELLQKNIAEMIIGDTYFHPDYIPVMKASIEEDVWVMNYLFVRTLQEQLPREDFIQVLKQSLHSEDLQVRWHSLVAVKEENLAELEDEVQALFGDPDSKLGRYAKRIAKGF